MSKFSEMTSNQILMEIKNMMQEHEAIKQRMLKDYDEMVRIEKLFQEANKELKNRLNGNRDE